MGQEYVSPSRARGEGWEQGVGVQPVPASLDSFGRDPRSHKRAPLARFPIPTPPLYRLKLRKELNYYETTGIRSTTLEIIRKALNSVPVTSVEAERVRYEILNITNIR